MKNIEMFFLAGFLHCTLETRWLGGSFLMVYRNNAGRLDSGFISVCLETRWLGQKSGFYVPERPCRESGCWKLYLEDRRRCAKPFEIRQNSLHFKVLASYLFCTHRAAHGLTVVFGIRSGFCVADCILCRANIEALCQRAVFGCLVDTWSNVRSIEY